MLHFVIYYDFTDDTILQPLKMRTRQSGRSVEQQTSIINGDVATVATYSVKSDELVEYFTLTSVNSRNCCTK